jgi:predicted Zn-dependent protease
MCEHHNDIHDHQDSETKSMLTKRRMIQALAAGGLVSIAAPGLSGCVTNAETGSSQFLGLVSEGALNQMAAQSWAQTKAKTKVSTDPRYTNRLKNIGGRIARGSNRADQPWDYAVFDSDAKNAFVLPGNKVGFYRGMMDFADNDDQLAAVMGHEVGHVAGRHAQARVNTQMAGQLGLAVGGIAGASQMGRKCKTMGGAQQRQCYQKASRNSQLLNAAMGMGFTLGVVLPFSRAHESQSDLLGARYMQRAGYDPHQSVRLWEKMAEASPRRQPELLSTHPDPSRRARDLHNFIACQERRGSQGWGNESLKAALKACSA